MLKDYPPLLVKSNELIEAWRTTLQAFDKFTEQSIKGCFFHMKMKVMFRILHHLSEENKLSIYDEKIFEYFDELINHYQNTIDLFNNNDKNIKTGKAKEILSGICTVLSSQLKQFRENQMVDQGIGDPKFLGNPIKVEKDRFLTEQKISVLDKLDYIETKWTNRKNNETTIESRKTLIAILKNEDDQYEFIKSIYQLLTEDTKEDLYKCYINKSKKGVEKLNDFHLRKAANFYYESIKQEKENIEAIIKIQVNALEEEMKVEDYEDGEQQIIQEILHTIREAYQHLGKEIEELEKFFKDAEKQPNKINLYTYEEFDEYLRTKGMDAYIKDLKGRKKVEFNNEELLKFYEAYERFHKIWDELKNEFLNTYFDQINKESIEDKVNKKIQSSIEMSDKIVNLFLDFNKKYDEKKELPQAEYTPIIKGIIETLSIKVESLQESIELFSSNTTEFLEDIKKELELFLEEYSLLEKGYERFIKEAYDIESISTLLDEILDEELQNFNRKVVRKYEKIEQEADKKIIKFLREHLLFEISTYEEIIYYSVSRLREEKEDFTVEYVKTIDYLTKAIEEVLKIHEIESINPTPHEKFNGKEHEVLMAEVKEGFNKGEIIKTMNRGYLYNKHIVLKANVIAGK